MFIFKKQIYMYTESSMLMFSFSKCVIINYDFFTKAPVKKIFFMFLFIIYIDVRKEIAKNKHSNPS